MNEREASEQPLEPAEAGDRRERETFLEMNRKPSLENPTWNYLFNNFTKADLQKHCRQIGIKKVYINKDQLVDMIMQNHQSTENETAATSQEEQSMDNLDNILQEIINLNKRMSKKDSEIEELNTMLKTAQVTINRLNDRITTLEDQAALQSRPNALPAVSEKILLLGDENLREILPSDLGENCSIRTLTDATLDLAKCWVDEKLDWIPSKCIIYCGIHDLMENENTASVLDDLGTLIAELKNKNENIELFTCELVPNLEKDLDDKINCYNEKLKEWTTVNGVKLINTNLNLKLGTGDIDEMCFSDEEPITVLNRCGVLKLLSAIDKQYKHLKLYENSRKSKDRMNSNNKQELPSDFGRRSNDDPSNFVNRTHTHRLQNHSTFRYGFGDKNYRSQNWPSYSVQSDPPLRNRSYNRHTGNYLQRGCYNCGEFNHRQANCRYDHRIRCSNCHRFGHKDSKCNLRQSNY